jgi:hypothetical protein
MFPRVRSHASRSDCWRIVRAVATSLFGILIFIVGAFASANVRKFASERGWDNGLVRLWDTLPEKLRDELRWQRLRGPWWLWAIFGLSCGVALALWLAPLFAGPPTIIAGPQAGAPPKTELRLQFYGGARIPTAIGTENVYYWYAQFSPSIGIKFTDKAGNEIMPPGGSPQYDPIWNIFVVLKKPAAIKQIVGTFSNPELLGPTEILGQTDRSFVFHSMKGIPAGELVVSGQP